MSDTIQKDWLDEAFGKRLDKIKEHVKGKWSGQPTIKWYTPHGESHSHAVEDQLHKLIPDDKYKQLRDIERFLLLSSAWLHDIGMIPNLLGRTVTDEKIREEHHKRTSTYIDENINELGLSVQEAEILQEICLYHRKREDIAKCTQLLNVGKDEVRVQLLAAYLRLADALHIDETRSDEYLYKIYLMTNIPREEKFHWIKSRSINDIIPSASKMNITAKMRIPEGWEKDRVMPLLDIIVEDIQEELDTVKNILTRGQITMFLEVIPCIETTKAKTSDQDRVKDLEDMLNNIDFLRSPNASKIIDVVLDNIITMCDLSDDSAIKRLIEYETTLLENVLIQKSCHVGLRVILGVLKDRLKSVRKQNVDSTSIENTKRDIKNEANRIKRERIEAKKNLQANAGPMLRDGGAILLFGYSDSVLAVLEGLSDTIKDNTEIYVSECRNKTRYDHDNKLVYCDAIHYADMVRKAKFKNVMIISDCTISNLMSRKKIGKVLLGANGVDKDYMVGHTVGHLNVADIAMIYNVPVYIVVEYMKFGDFEHKPDLERDNNWLTTMKLPNELLAESGIRTLNYREDIVPPDKIYMYITDVGNFPSQLIGNIERARSVD